MGLVEKPEPALTSPRSVKVRITMTGICGTDHKIVSGKHSGTPGVVLGHEGTGIVAEIGGDVRSVRPGQRVVLNPTQGCQVCLQCRRGNLCYCDNFDEFLIGFTMDGTFAEYFVTDERYVYPIPDSMTWNVASLIEPLGCALNGILKADLHAWDTVAVIGSGAIGLLCQILAARTAARVVAIETDDYRRAFAARIAHTAIHPDELTATNLPLLTGGQPKFDVVIDAVGTQLDFGYPLVAKGGRLIPMGLDSDYRMTLPATAMIDDGISIRADVPLHDAIGPAIIIAPQLPILEELVTTQADLSDFASAFEATMGYTLSTGDRTPIRAIKAALTSLPLRMLSFSILTARCLTPKPPGVAP
ncbi:alcohol dehydrogenase catalytic domain-containing protein [Agreia pratensis]|uniref:zinc-dependent alcohol dehydrogenase n=1 Tax=Agreia pratensis TaxID=150121 RepID=UPI00188A2B6C|nr:alcohol dehydrogenase catalytic domain-containing protein [Agreia pratensis]MBF4635791.1 alcohol dehydrogenase catalytic domain-containing protein [Agreia pratensis]